MEYSYSSRQENLKLGLAGIEDGDSFGMCSISVSKADLEPHYGNFNVISVNSEQTKAMVVANIPTNGTLKNGDVLKIIFGKDYEFVYNTPGDPNSGGTSKCKTNIPVEWNADIEENNEKLEYVFDKTVVLKENAKIKIVPTRILINPLGIDLDLMLYYNGEAVDNDDLIKFDKTIDIIFGDGRILSFNSVMDEATLIEGSNVIVDGVDKDNKPVKLMYLRFNNIFTTNPNSSDDFNVLYTNKVTRLRIGEFEHIIR